MINTSSLNSWMERNGIEESAKYAIARSVAHTGQKTTGFFTNAIEDELDILPEELGEAIAISLGIELEQIGKKNKNITITRK